MVRVKCSIQECFTLTLPGPTSGVHCANNETSRFSNIQREGEQGVNLLPAFNNLETPPPSPILSEKVNKGSISYQRSITLKPPPLPHPLRDVIFPHSFSMFDFFHLFLSDNRCPICCRSLILKASLGLH